MSDFDIIAKVHNMEASAARHTCTSFSTENALCLFTSKLDSALKEEWHILHNLSLVEDLK